LLRVDAEVEGLLLPLTPQDQTPATLVFAGGGKLSADLVVGADGTTSRLRSLAGIEHRVRDYRQTAIVTNFEAERSHRDCAWQWFGSFGVVALLPLSGGNLQHGRSRVSLVWSAASEEAASALRQPGELPALVQSMTLNRLGALHPITPPAAFVLRAVQCRQVIKPSFVLIGDAAHAIHPMAGQGMNLGFGDVRGLIDHLMSPSGTSRAPVRPPDWFELRRYERSRREPVVAMQLALEGLHRAFGKIPVPLAGLRDLGWSIVAGSSWLRRRMIEHAVS
jgi:ubiquinone biosynthesis UbiH/UbiF/VisC/COQ6 family hydroxylase